MISFIVWKGCIVVYFLIKVGLSVFTWANIRFYTFNSTIGIINFILAIIIKAG